MPSRRYRRKNRSRFPLSERRVLRNAGRLIVVIFICAPLTFAAQKGAPQRAGPRPAHELTDEEKEMLRQRELLENLELLRNFEKIKYLDLLTPPKPGKDKAKKAPKPAPKDSERKNVNS